MSEPQNKYQKAATLMDGVGRLLFWIAATIAMGGITLALVHH